MAEAPRQTEAASVPRFVRGLAIVPAFLLIMGAAAVPVGIAASVWINHDVLTRRADLESAAFLAVQGFTAAMFACVAIYCVVFGIAAWASAEADKAVHDNGGHASPLGGAVSFLAALFPGLCAVAAGGWGLLIHMGWAPCAAAGVCIALSLIQPTGPLALWFRIMRTIALAISGASVLSLIPLFI
ncbi:hypothetical protein GC169_07725 [bacterium]|nr:hypothetical protein [bacterium]